MPLYKIEKSIKTSYPLVKIENLIIEDDFTYVTLYEGIRVQGVINIKGNFVYEYTKESFNDKIDVDILCPNDQIEDKKGIKLKVSDYEYLINEDEIKFIFKCVLEGKLSSKEVFEYPLKGTEITKELILERSKTLLNEEELSELETVINNEDATFITTLENDELIDDVVEVDEEPFEDNNIEDNVIKEEKVIPLVKDNTIIEDNSTLIVTSFYKVGKFDNKETIMKNCNLSEQEYEKLEVKEGLLIKIRR